MTKQLDTKTKDFFESVILYIEVPKGHDEIDKFNDILNAINSHKRIIVDNGFLVHNGHRVAFTFNHISYEDRPIKSYKLRLLSNAEHKVSTPLKRDLIKLLESRDLNVSVLWDDTYLKHSSEAYLKIHSIENRLRAKLNEDMLNNYGTEWHKSLFPPKLKSSVSSKVLKTKNPNSQDLFMACDFIELNSFLFEEFRTKDLDQIISESESIDQDKLSKLKEAVRQNNWSRIFINIFQSKDSDFKSKWERLYKLRNIIAHNRPFSKSDLDEAKNLINYFDNLILTSRKYYRPGVKIESHTKSGHLLDKESGTTLYAETTTSSNLVIKVQQALKDSGYDVPCNNTLDKATREILVIYQKENNLPVGNLNIETMQSLEIKGYRDDDDFIASFNK